MSLRPDLAIIAANVGSTPVAQRLAAETAALLQIAMGDVQGGLRGVHQRAVQPRHVAHGAWAPMACRNGAALRQASSRSATGWLATAGKPRTRCPGMLTGM